MMVVVGLDNVLLAMEMVDEGYSPEEVMELLGEEI
jgi:hypothetical protein